MSSHLTRLLARDDPTDRELVQLLGQLDDLLERIGAAESAWSGWVAAVDPAYRASARNVVHYWAIRQADLRDLQIRLAVFGLSSLGRSESHVEETLRVVRSAVAGMLKDTWHPPAPAAVGSEEGRELLRCRTVDLLGPTPADRETRIMVTLPSEAATNPDLVHGLVQRGMNVARINCAHDDPTAWRAMVEHVRHASALLGRSCLVAMDLAGPKLRTGPIQPGPRVIKLRPSRDGCGRVLAPACAWLTSAEDRARAPEPEMVTLPVPGQWLDRRNVGDVLTLHDARGAKRQFTVISLDAGGVVATTDKTTYVATATTFHVDRADDPTEVGLLPELEQSLVLRPADMLNVTRDCSPAPSDPDGVPWIGCTLPEVFDHARIGEKIYFDDGRIGGEIIAAGHDLLRVRIDRAASFGSKLRAAKGINVPDTQLPVPALTEKDISDLATAVEVADFVDMSFVQDPVDLLRLHEALTRLGGDRLGVVLKIETRRAFERLAVAIDRDAHLESA